MKVDSSIEGSSGIWRIPLLLGSGVRPPMHASYCWKLDLLPANVRSGPLQIAHTCRPELGGRCSPLDMFGVDEVLVAEASFQSQHGDCFIKIADF